jgi:N,N'-diacetylchitobiose phosphorylase
MNSLAANNPRTERLPRDLNPPRPSLVEPATLSNGRYNVRLSEAGSGYSEAGGIAVTRWSADATRDADGFFVYLQDLDDGFAWSAGYQPTRVVPSRYAFRRDDNRAEIIRQDRDIECRTTVFVAEHYNFEVRTCQVTNLGKRARRLQLTSYLEWVLGSQEADRSHPAFSKLFVETQYCSEHHTILARRRPRHGDESEILGFHTLLRRGKAISPDELQFETNRLRFIGRGRSLRAPLALEPGATLSGDCGPVLDPCASLRLSVGLEAGESHEIAFVLGQAENRREIVESIAAANELTQMNSPAHETIPSNFENGKPIRTVAPGFLEAISKEENYQPANSVGSGATSQAGNLSPLQFDNSYGGFSADGGEYIIRLRPDGKGGLRRPPMPWTNVIANEKAGFLVTESGAGYTWSGNSRTNRLTAWNNDPVCDPHAEALWIRDEDLKQFWSPTPGPTCAAGEYEVRHGFGYTTFRHTSHELSQETTMFMARDEPVKFSRVRIMNQSGRKRRLSIYSYIQWALGSSSAETASAIATVFDGERPIIWASNPARELYGECVAFSSLAVDGSAKCESYSYTCNRASFLGQYGEMQAPAAIVSSDTLDGRIGAGLDPCAAWQLRFELSPGEAFECTFLLGETTRREFATSLVSKYADPLRVQEAFADAKQFWQQLLSAVTIETPDKEIDLLVNGWLTYQNLSCRMWARSAYYQPGGAFGFRDQLQDSAALVHHRPDITRAQILRHASQQFVEGDVLHWWHPDTGYGVRTRFSDDLLWLPCVTAEYVARTGDIAILDEQVAFVAAPPLSPGQQEAYLRPEPAGVVASLYEHCCRALDRGLTSGPNGLPLIGCGDWNDGFSRVGRQGTGESVWLGFFIDYVLRRFLPICSSRDDQAHVARYTNYANKLADALNGAGWDGAWYRRAYYDNGQPIGSAESDECEIDALAQAWSVISGVAPPERAEMAMRAAEDRLVCEKAGMIRLLSPPFDRTPNDPGYIKGYLPGIRENGGQYTHGVLWTVRALAELGHGTRAVNLLRMLTPIWHSNSKDRADIYQTEPYVVAADVYGEPPHVGRGGWTWYTGSAGWMFRVAIESIFGISCDEGRALLVNPSIASTWPQCRLLYRLPDGNTCYDISIENAAGNEHGVSEAILDGQPAVVANGVARLPLVKDGTVHRVVIRL